MKSLLLSGTTVSLFFQVAPISLLAGIVYAIVRYAHLKKQSLPVCLWAEIIRILFVCYLTGLFNLVLVPVNLWTAVWFYLFQGYDGVGDLGWFSGDFNFTPTLIKCLSGELSLGSWVREMLIGNFLMFLPLGLFLPFVTKKQSLKKVFVLAAAVPVVIELLQPVVGRSFDVDDLICNFLGVMTGYALGSAVSKLVRSRGKEQSA